MTDKLSEFRRINEPRALRALEQLGLIQKSAGSMKIPQTDVNQMLTPVFEHMRKLKATDRKPGSISDVERTPDQPDASIEATPPVAREASNLETLTTQQLVDRMIACGAILAKRRQ